MFIITAKEHYIDGNDNKVKIHSFVKFWQIGMKSVTVNVWLSPGFRLHFLFRIHRIVQLGPILLSEWKLNLKTQVRFCELAYNSLSQNAGNHKFSIAWYFEGNRFPLWYFAEFSDFSVKENVHRVLKQKGKLSWKEKFTRESLAH